MDKLWGPGHGQVLLPKSPMGPGGPRSVPTVVKHQRKAGTSALGELKVSTVVFFEESE